MGTHKLILFAGGFLAGTVGLKLMKSKEAKKVYTQCAAAALRGKDCVMKTYTAAKENCDDILADAKAINEERAAREIIEDESENQGAASGGSEA